MDRQVVDKPGEEAVKKIRRLAAVFDSRMAKVERLQRLRAEWEMKETMARVEKFGREAVPVISKTYIHPV